MTALFDRLARALERRFEAHRVRLAAAEMGRSL